MKVVFIYGPPASGKLTVAKELSKLTGYKIFHNHMTVDLLEPFIKINEKFWNYNEILRKEVFKIFLKENVNVIFTFCYVGEVDKKFINEIKNMFKLNNGKIYFVHLIPDKKEILKRVKHAERKKYGKITHVKTLKCAVGKYDFYSSINPKSDLIIDNTKLSPKKVALKIKDHYKL
jgi:hypothetical protein